MYDENGERSRETLPTWVAVSMSAIVVGGLVLAACMGWLT